MTGPDERLGPIIRNAIAGFVATLDRNPSANDVTLSDLAKSLDRLVAVYFETVEVDPGDDEAPRREHSDYKTTYARIGRAYPSSAITCTLGRTARSKQRNAMLAMRSMIWPTSSATCAK